MDSDSISCKLGAGHGKGRVFFFWTERWQADGRTSRRRDYGCDPEEKGGSDGHPPQRLFSPGLASQKFLTGLVAASTTWRGLILSCLQNANSLYELFGEKKILFSWLYPWGKKSYSIGLYLKVLFSWQKSSYSICYIESSDTCMEY